MGWGKEGKVNNLTSNVLEQPADEYRVDHSLFLLINAIVVIIIIVIIIIIIVIIIIIIIIIIC